MQKFEDIVNKISEANNILIISHIGPDGDTIGSTLALADIINNNFENKNVHFVIQHKLPDIYKTTTKQIMRMLISMLLLVIHQVPGKSFTILRKK